MRIPLFITGFARSGTTLVRRLVSMHPDLDYELVHENIGLLLKARSAEQAVKLLTYPATEAGKQTGSTMSLLSGMKQPYCKYREGHKYVRKFLKLFPGASVIHVVRNPFSAVSSQSRTFLRPPSRAIRDYFRAVPKMTAYLRTLQNCLEIGYEELTARPEKSVSMLYGWMGAQVRDEYLKRVLTTRGTWEYQGRRMPGLRYFDKVNDRPVNLEPLRTEHVEKIKVLCCKYDMYVDLARQLTSGNDVHLD